MPAPAPDRGAPAAAGPRVGRDGRPLAGRRVLILVENLPVPFDRRVWQECRALIAAGAEVSVICPTGKGHESRFELREGVHIYRHPLPVEAAGAAGYLLEYGAALFHEMRLALRVARQRGFDTIQGCNPPDLLFLVALPFKLAGRRYIFDHHDIAPELFETKFGRRGVLWRLMLLLERVSFRVADTVIATNDSYREIAMTRGGKRAEDVFVVRSGPDLERLQRLPPDPAWRRGRAHLVGYVGVMGAQEGLDLLLEAARIMILEAGMDVQLVLAGDGPERPALERLADALGVAGHVHFAGRIPDAELFAMLSTADICVNPDRATPMNDKSTMNKIMEYMAFARPIVQFDVTEGRVSAGEASLYAAPDDARDLAARMRELLADPARARRMGEAGRRRVEEELHWGAQIDSLIAAYRRSAA